jgi:hypothetical protein
MIAGLAGSLPEGTVLLNPGSLRAAADFVVHDGRDGPPELRRTPATLDALLLRIESLSDGAVVYVKSNLQEGFFKHAMPRLRAGIVLITAEGDWASPGPHRRYLDDTHIIRWFGQNCDLAEPHAKFEPIPLGFAEPHWPHGDPAAMLRVHRRMLALIDKPVAAHASFHLNLSHPHRATVWATLQDRPGIIFEPRRIPPELLWIRHVGYAFAISPRGAGRDCHRTWEALLLRTVPIVESSCLDPIYEGFPVVRVDDWRSVTPDAMRQWQVRFADAFTPEMFERLTARHWFGRIRAAAGSSPP